MSFSEKHFKKKYLKYKTKYNQLKTQIGGAKEEPLYLTDIKEILIKDGKAIPLYKIHETENVRKKYFKFINDLFDKIKIEENDKENKHIIAKLNIYKLLHKYQDDFKKKFFNENGSDMKEGSTIIEEIQSGFNDIKENDDELLKHLNTIVNQVSDSIGYLKGEKAKAENAKAAGKNYDWRTLEVKFFEEIKVENINDTSLKEVIKRCKDLVKEINKSYWLSYCAAKKEISNCTQDISCYYQPAQTEKEGECKPIEFIGK
tara:strand:+ start:39 stop:815 length:777 start_codon:yes stop_codon:yes gene_type:complete